MEESVVLSDAIEMLIEFQRGNLEEAEEKTVMSSRMSPGYDEFTSDWLQQCI